MDDDAPFGARLTALDAVLDFSVAVGNADMGISAGLLHAIDLARSVGASIYGIMGPDGAYTTASMLADVEAGRLT